MVILTSSFNQWCRVLVLQGFSGSKTLNLMSLIIRFRWDSPEDMQSFHSSGSVALKFGWHPSPGEIEKKFKGQDPILLQNNSDMHSSLKATALDVQTTKYIILDQGRSSENMSCPISIEFYWSLYGFMALLEGDCIRNRPPSICNPQNHKSLKTALSISLMSKFFWK